MGVVRRRRWRIGKAAWPVRKDGFVHAEPGMRMPAWRLAKNLEPHRRGLLLQ